MTVVAHNTPLGFSGIDAQQFAALLASTLDALPGIPLVGHVRLTNAQILAGQTPVSIVSGVPGKILVPLAGIAVGDDTAGTFGPADLTFGLRHTGGGATVLFSFGAVFGNGLARRRISVASWSGATLYDTAAFNPAGAGLSVVGLLNTINGNAANYLDVTIFYEVMTNPV